MKCYIYLYAIWLTLELGEIINHFIVKFNENNANTVFIILFIEVNK
jgi:hypothetical protein